MTETTPKRARRLRPWLIALAVIAVGLPLAAYGALWAALRSDAVRPRIEAAVEAATGRRLTLGALTVRPALVPTIGIENPVLANPPGFSRPEMMRARRIEAELALMPLLSRRVELRRLSLVEPDLLLETAADGRVNWSFARLPAPAPSGPAAAPSEPSRPFGVAVDAVTIERGRVTWRAPGVNGGAEEVVELPRLTLRTEARGVLAEGQAVVRGVAATVNGGTGPLAALLEGGAGDLPFRAGLSAPGLNGEVSGSAALPARPEGWRVRVAATADTAARLAPFLPGTALPEARMLSLVAEAVGGLGLTTLHASVAEAVLPLAGRPLRIGPAQLSVPENDAPATLTGTLRLGEMPLNLVAQGPGLDAIRGGGAVPLTLRVEGEGASGVVEGALAPGLATAGTEWRVTFRAGDLRAIGARSGSSGLPALHDLTVSGPVRLRADGGEMPEAVLSAREAAGRAALSWRAGAPRPAVTLRAGLERLDLDAMLAAAPAGPAPTAAPAAPAAPAPQATAPAPAAPPAAAPAEAPRPRQEVRVIPDRPVDLSALRAIPADLDAQATLGLLRWHGADWRDLSLRAVFDGTTLTGERFAAATPGGAVSGRFSAALPGGVPRIGLALRSGEGGVDPAALLAGFGLRLPLEGRGALDLDLRGEGAGLRALAGSLAGHVGLAMTGGRIDPALIAGATEALRGVLPPQAAGGGAELHCLALRFDLQSGVAQSRALLVQTGVASTTGGGAANLGDETLAFRLRPVIRVGEVSLTTPLGITGRFAAPRFSLDPNAGTAAAAGVLGGLAQRPGDPAVGALVEGLLGGRGAPPADCAAQLAIARGEAPAAGPAPAAAPPQRERRPAVGDLLRGLLGR